MEDKFEKLTRITEDYEADPALATRVIQRINQRESTVAFKKPMSKLKWQLLCGLLVVVAAFLAVFLPVYLSGKSRIQIAIYTDENIVFEELTDLSQFVADNALNIEYFADVSSASRCAKIIDTEELAFVTQEFDYIGESGFDKLKLGIIIMQNAKFETFNGFEVSNDKLQISDIEVEYIVSYVSLDEKYNFKATFEVENYTYFLEIDTVDSETTVLEKYINKLLN